MVRSARDETIFDEGKTVYFTGSPFFIKANTLLKHGTPGTVLPGRCDDMDWDITWEDLDGEGNWVEFVLPPQSTKSKLCLPFEVLSNSDPSQEFKSKYNVLVGKQMFISQSNHKFFGYRCEVIGPPDEYDDTFSDQMRAEKFLSITCAHMPERQPVVWEIARGSLSEAVLFIHGQGFGHTGCGDSVYYNEMQAKMGESASSLKIGTRFLLRCTKLKNKMIVSLPKATDKKHFKEADPSQFSEHALFEDKDGRPLAPGDKVTWTVGGSPTPATVVDMAQETRQSYFILGDELAKSERKMEVKADKLDLLASVSPENLEKKP